MQAYEYQTEEVLVSRRFLEQIIMQESLSTIRVLTYFVTGTQTGQNDQPNEIEASYSDISQATGLCRQSVQEGLNRAIEQGYLRQVQPGNFFGPASYQVLGIGGQVSGHGCQGTEAEEEQVGVLAKESEIESYPNYAYQKDEERSRNQEWSTFHTTPPLDSRIESRVEDRIESVEAVYFPDHPQKVDHAATYPPEVIHISAYLTNMSHDFSVELGDPTHTRSNRTQIHNLWHKSGLAEKDFAQVMYEARKLTKQFALLRPGEKEPPSGQIRNRMAYFFAVLRDLLGLPTKNQVTQRTPENQLTNHRGHG